jgi:hypothetical protein
MNYILYKNPIQNDTLAIVQYIHHQTGQNIGTRVCIERNYPSDITELPSIRENGKIHTGLSECIQYFSQISGLPAATLYQNSCQFKRDNPEYRIH